MYTQDAAVGSNALGGVFDIFLGAPDNPSSGPINAFTVWSALTPANFSGSVPTYSSVVQLISAFAQPVNDVASIALGWPGAAGTQLVLEGLFNSMGCHAPLQVFSLDNATSGQAFINIHNVDPGRTFPAAFNFTYDVFSTGASGDDVGIQVIKRDHSSIAISRYIDVQLNNLTTTKRRWSVIERSGLAAEVFYDIDGSTSAATGLVSWPWASSTTTQKLVEQRNAGNSADLDIISRSLGVLTFGSAAETAQIGSSVAVGADAAKTLTHGATTGKDGDINQLFATNTTATTANQNVASITLTSSASTQLEVKIVGVDQTNGNTATFTLQSAFTAISGTVTQLTGGPAAVDTGHSAGATGVSPTLAVVSNIVQVQVTPWTTNNTHWYVSTKQAVNTGTF